MSAPTIRAATVDDAERISELIVTLGSKYITPGFSAEGRRRFLSDHTQVSITSRIMGEYQYHVAESEDELVGVVGMRNPSHLYHLFVDDRYQRQGLGRRLWEHAKTAAGNPALVTVNSSLNAVAVYEHLGFVVAGPTRNVYEVLFVPMRWRAES
jgi:GNAT superfamily N-acetyltransferase